ncbi:MAG: tyrosinase family protein, partial [Bacteroidota bacterium]
WHRYYINELENWLLANGGAEFVPLPYWDPEDPIPSAFAGNSSLVDPNVTFSGNTLASIHSGHSTNVANQVNLNDVMVDNSSDCSSWATADDFANAAEFGNGNHNAVHNAIGGIMSGHYSPSSTIFWCWHAYVDDLWLCYQKYCAPGNVDAMVRDCVGDDGTEPSPNPPCDKLWKSPDIWVRNSADGFTNQQNQTLFQTSFDNTAYVYVRVWNVGDLPVTPGDVDLDLYWANASTGLSWPNPWNGSTLNCGGNNVPMGGTIANNLQITRISEPYQQSNVTPTVDTEPYIIVEAVWTIPDPDHYTSCFTNQWEAEHFCVLAILDDGNPVNPSPFYSGLRNYNNMALKNVTIVGDGQQMIVVNDPHDECVLIANHSRRPMEDVTLTLEMEGRNNVLEVADVFFDLEPVALELWNQGGRKGQNVRMHRDGRIQLTGDGATLQGIALQPNQISNLCLTFVPTQATGETFEFDIVQRNGEEVIGGETFLIEGITDRATIDKRSSGQQQVLQSRPMQSYVYPNPASEFIRYEVLDGNQLSQLSLYDIQGRLVLSKFAQDDYGRIPVADQARGTYLLKLVFKDGSFETHKVILK